MLLIAKDRTENSGGLRIPAAEIEHLVSSRVRRWLLDPGSIYKSTSARLPDASIQQQLVARTAEIGKHWPELPVARKRAVLTGLIERVEVSVDQIDIRLRSSRLSALLDAAATSQSVNDDETEILSVPVRLRRAGREIRMVIDGTDPFAASKPDARLIRLLIRACRFNAALAQGEGIHFAGSGGCCSNATIASGAGLAPEHSAMPTGGNSAFLVRPNFRDQHQRQSRFSVPSYQRPARRGFVRRPHSVQNHCPEMQKRCPSYR